MSETFGPLWPRVCYPTPQKHYIHWKNPGEFFRCITFYVSEAKLSIISIVLCWFFFASRKRCESENAGDLSCDFSGDFLRALQQKLWFRTLQFDNAAIFLQSRFFLGRKNVCVYVHIYIYISLSQSRASRKAEAFPDAEPLCIPHHLRGAPQINLLSLIWWW